MMMRSGQRKACLEVERQIQRLLGQGYCSLRCPIWIQFPSLLTIIVFKNKNKKKTTTILAPRRAAVPFSNFYSTLLQRPCFHRRGRGHQSPRHSPGHGHRSYPPLPPQSPPLFLAPPLPGHIPTHYHAMVLQLAMAMPCLAIPHAICKGSYHLLNVGYKLPF